MLIRLGLRTDGSGSHPWVHHGKAHWLEREITHDLLFALWTMDHVQILSFSYNSYPARVLNNPDRVELAPREANTMYEITTYLSREADLTAFLDTTKNFGKKSYHYGGGGRLLRNGTEFPLFRVTAIAISRDVTYILYWDFPYDCHIEAAEYYAKESKLEDEEAAGKFPLKNAYPHDEKDRKLFYPYLSLEESGRPYENVFASYGFTRANTISKDGRPLLY